MLDNFKIASSAFFSKKLASSKLSPASAQANLKASAPNFYTISSIVKKFPVDLDILAPFTKIQPLQKKDLGHLFTSSFQIAAWLNKDIVKWFLIKSFPLHLKSIGYQYSNSCLKNLSNFN